MRQRLRNRFVLATAACLLASACSGLGSWSRGDADVRRRARIERAEYLELEIARLKADLRQAEEAMLAIGAGLRGGHTRAHAVSALAEARISVERAGESAAWRRSQLEEARAKLEEAERQIQAGHSGTALYFASRARRIADTPNQEARRPPAGESAGGALGRGPDPRRPHRRHPRVSRAAQTQLVAGADSVGSAGLGARIAAARSLIPCPTSAPQRRRSPCPPPSPGRAPDRRR